jgi:hypothetical protein
MRRIIRTVLWIYLAGIILLEFYLLHGFFRSGEFSRIGSVSQFVAGLGASLALAEVWPVLVIGVALQLLGIIPFDPPR